MDYITQLDIFYSEIMRLIDEGNQIPIEELEKICTENNIIDYIGTKFGFKDVRSLPQNQNLLKEKLNNLCISENDVHKRQISKNGLVYLAVYLFDILREEYFDCKWNIQIWRGLTIEKKRTILEDKLYELVTVDGIIEKHGNLKFDGYDRMVTTKPGTEYFNPIRKYDDGCIDVVYHKNMTTLLRDCKIDGKSISDGHLWFPMNLSYNNDFKTGDKIKIIGHVEMYKRQDGTYDYCINPTRVEK